MGSNIFLKITIYVLIFFSFCVVFFEVFWFSQKFSSGDIMKVNAKTYNIPSMNKNWSLTHFERLEYLTSQCLTYKEDLNKSSVLEDEQVLEHILVDKKHKLLYCYVPKVACTNWKRIFLILVGQINTTDPSSIPADVAHKLTMNYKLSNFSKDEIHHFLESYTKFLFVRHPFERLVSAFHNKLEQSYSSSKYFQSRFGKHIIKTIRTRPTNHSLNHGDDVTFNEFATFLTKNGRGEEMNEHWRPVHHLCQPCKINYDFIGKHETLYEDANLLLREIGVPQVKFPPPPISDTRQRITQQFLNLSHTTIAQLYKLFFMDFKLFNYDLKAISNSVTYVYVDKNDTSDVNITWASNRTSNNKYLKSTIPAITKGASKRRSNKISVSNFHNATSTIKEAKKMLIDGTKHSNSSTATANSRSGNKFAPLTSR